MKYIFNLEQLCPATFAFHVISGKWNLPILAYLSEEEAIRYNELKRRLPGITGTTLTNCLKDLINYGIIHREQYNEVPPRVEYSLSPSGRELVPLIASIVAWGERNIHSLEKE
ncbi:helix-turn-helix domain-containing protein [Paenibacillus sp. MMS20-IR301]|uniref:winged helix-turn-helix transcriptional regulator n=1 Tax=Paenibacillus sp. MMS20-IR301 TaxID=2895946 RepID=UPI0028EC87F6|nr:helix-turn-helix domain-containing protein [Paenibacillus sp. MMS20-IR301]WNS40755.1 helix-turn-helix domain-containing protein [Paenibacillus sp. MMS20-IR301]